MDKIIKTVTKTNIHEITYCSSKKSFMKWGHFKKIRTEHGQSISLYKKCFSCDHKFEDDEDIYVATVTQKGNVFFCLDCSKKYE
jgi:hypothetical protein